jgi:hypothetical protein
MRFREGQRVCYAPLGYRDEVVEVLEDEGEDKLVAIRHPDGGESYVPRHRLRELMTSEA